MVAFYHGYWAWRQPNNETAFTVFAAVQFGTLLGLLFWMGATNAPLGLRITFGTLGGVAAYCLVAWIDEVSLHLSPANRMTYMLCYGNVAKPSLADPMLTPIA
jgi:hypothetical protein